jgi:hypothetical protein
MAPRKARVAAFPVPLAGTIYSCLASFVRIVSLAASPLNVWQPPTRATSRGVATVFGASWLWYTKFAAPSLRSKTR